MDEDGQPSKFLKKVLMARKGTNNRVGCATTGAGTSSGDGLLPHHSILYF